MVEDLKCAACGRMSDASQWKERSNSEWRHSQTWIWSTMNSLTRPGIHNEYTYDSQSCQFRRGAYTLPDREKHYRPEEVEVAQEHTPTLLVGQASSQFGSARS
jgi:hypothetical protein